MKKHFKQKKAELDELQKDIDSLEDQALSLKNVVKKYNDLKSRSAELKKVKRMRQREFNTVTSFFQTVDDNYINNLFPLFAPGQKEAATA